MTFDTTWGRVPSDFIKWENNPNYTRKEVTILAGSGSDRELLSGYLCAEVKGVAAVLTGTGDGTFDSGYASTSAQNGIYLLTCIDASVSGSEIFAVTDPEGNNIGTATVGVAFSTDAIGFTLTGGATAFDTTSVWTVTITDGTWERINWSGINGSQIPGGLLFLDATAPDGSTVQATMVTGGPAILNYNQIDDNSANAAQILLAKQALVAAGFAIEQSA
ncbi:MAG: hypothetical protein GY760_15975 [Deltaproteobacteria bacterium]|nr:hypothetical protein [Deltaproteobacteria bacterium]